MSVFKWDKKREGQRVWESQREREGESEREKAKKIDWVIIIAEENVREREEGIQKERNTICIMLIIQGGGREDIENE